VKFIVDAQLPRRLAYFLADQGYDAVHTLDLPSGNRTDDNDIIEIAINEQRVIITKDQDFADSFALRQHSWQLLLVRTGNISNSELLELFERSLPQIVATFAQSDFFILMSAHTKFDW
jgi:predicted nuclease of predicted toxin-antitoxin system